MTDDNTIPKAALPLLGGHDYPNALPFDRFADTMASLASTVCVVTAGSGIEATGRTVTSVISVSATPSTLLVSITRDSELAQTIETTQGFSLALLAHHQREIGNAFAGKGSQQDRFAIGTWDHWPSGRPVLEGATANIDCRLAGTVTLDTHCLYLGVLIDSRIVHTPPLIWRERGYRALA